MNGSDHKHKVLVMLDELRKKIRYDKCYKLSDAQLERDNTS